MVAVPILVGEDITVTYLTNKLDWTAQTKQQTADLTVNNTTSFTTSADLTIPVIAASYSFEACIMYDTASAADFALQITYPSSTTGLIANNGSPTSITTATNAINQQATALSGTSITLNYGGVAAGTIMAVLPSGAITVAIAGNLVIGFSQVTATAANTLLKRYSWIRLSRTV